MNIEKVIYLKILVICKSSWYDV